MTQKTRRGWGERERFLSQIARAWITLFLRRPQYLADSQPGTGYSESTCSLLSSPHMMMPDSNEISNVSTNPGHPDRTACYLLSVFQKYILPVFPGAWNKRAQTPHHNLCNFNSIIFGHLHFSESQTKLHN